MNFRPAHLRTRLTLWYTAVFGAVLLLFIAGASMLQHWQLLAELYHSEIQDMETAEGLLYFTSAGMIAMHQEYHNSLQDKLRVDRLMQVMTPEGRVLFRNDKLGGLDLGGRPFLHEGFHVYNRRRVRLADNTPVLLISHIHSIAGKPLLIRLGYSLIPIQDQVRTSLDILLLAFFPTMLLAGYGGYRITLKALQPLEQMALTTEKITAERLSQRLQLEHPDDELGHMARVLNGLLARLEDSFDQLKRFTADASHELRTPLASLRATGELAFEKCNSVEEYRETIGSMLEEVTRLTDLIERLLLISRADAGQIELKRTTLAWLDLVRESSAIMEILAEEKHQRIEISGDTQVLIRADRDVLRHAMINLIDNAVKCSPPGGLISLELKRCGQLAEFSVKDQGPGIAEKDQAKVFDRFFRCDSGRARSKGGDGLGLAIAQWAVQANGGVIGLSSIETQGSCFFIRLPLQEPGSAMNAESSEMGAYQTAGSSSESKAKAQIL